MRLLMLLWIIEPLYIFELAEIECLQVMEFRNYSLFRTIYEEAEKLRRVIPEFL